MSLLASLRDGLVRGADREPRAELRGAREEADEPEIDRALVDAADDEDEPVEPAVKVEPTSLQHTLAKLRVLREQKPPKRGQDTLKVNKPFALAVCDAAERFGVSLIGREVAVSATTISAWRAALGRTDRLPAAPPERVPTVPRFRCQGPACGAFQPPTAKLGDECVACGIPIEAHVAMMTSPPVRLRPKEGAERPTVPARERPVAPPPLAPAPTPPEVVAQVETLAQLARASRPAIAPAPGPETDPELDVIATCVRALSTIDRKTADRVLSYLDDRFGTRSPT